MKVDRINKEKTGSAKLRKLDKNFRGKIHHQITRGGREILRH